MCERFKLKCHLGSIQDNLPRPYKQQQRSSEGPTGAKVNRRRFARHLFHVLAQSRRTVEPGDGDHLEEGQEHDGDGCGVMVDQLEEVDSALEK